MIYKFVDQQGTFVINSPHKYPVYFPLTNANGTILSAINPNFSGDIKKDNDHFLTLPASIEDLRSNLLCRREFFLKANGSIIRLSQPCGQDSLEAGFLYHKITKKTHGLVIEALNFIPHDLDCEIMQISIENITEQPIEIVPTSFIPLYGRSEKNLRDHRHVSSLLNRIVMDAYGIELKPTMIFDEKGHKRNQCIYYVYGYQDDKVAPIGQFPTLDSFYGCQDILHPEAIEKDLPVFTSCQDHFQGQEVCAAFRFATRQLAPRQKTNFVLMLGIDNRLENIKNTFAQLGSLDKVKESLDKTRDFWRSYLGEVEFDLGHKDINGWLEWVKFQPTLRRLFGCSFLPHFDYGKGGRGWRDLWQDALALLLTEPDKAKQIILNSFQGVRLDGSNATIIAKDGFIADRNKISRVWMDHGVWPYLTTRSYIACSGDIEMLLKETTYFRDHQLKRAQETDNNFNQNDFLQYSSKGRLYQGSILEHILVQNLVQFFNVGKHNVVRLENADWNDGLDMAPDKGESVAFSFMYAHNIADLIRLLEKIKAKTKYVMLFKELGILLDTLARKLDYDDYQAKQKRLAVYLDKVTRLSGVKTKVSIDDLIKDLQRKSQAMAAWLDKKEWLKEGFFNGYYDNKGKRVEGVSKGRTNMLLASQVFAIMSRVASYGQINQTYASIKKYLYDKKLAGFRLNTDFKDIYTDLGRAYGFSYGDKENGAFFSHMNVMLAYALYSRGFVQQGFEVINSIYEMAIADRAMLPPVLPEYFNSQGQGLYLYLTGSASWYVYTLMQEVLGVKFEDGSIVLEPKLVSHNFSGNNITVAFNFHNKRVKVVYQKQTDKDQAYSIQSVSCNGSALLSRSDQIKISLSQLTASSNTIQVSLE